MALKNIHTIISEEIEKYIQNIINESLFEDSEESAKKRTQPLSDKEKKVRARIEKANKRDGDKVGTNVSQEVRDFLNDPSVNVSDVIEKATGLAPTSASSLGAKIAKGERPVKAKLAQTVHQIQNQLG